MRVAMNHRLRSALIIAGVILVDRLTKLYIQSAFGPYDSVPVIPGIFNIVHVENPGAAFGMLSEASGAWRSWVLIGASVCIMVIIGVMLWRPRPANAASSSLIWGR